MSSARLRVSGDPALALIVRIFVGAAAERCGVAEAVRDDLRLAASELFSGAVEAGVRDPITFEIASTGDAVELLTSDVPGDVPTEMPEGERNGRFDLVRALFPDAEIGDIVRIRVPVGT